MTPPDIQELAALYSFGMLDEPEREAVKKRLDPDFAAEIEAFHHVTGALGAAVAPVAPPASLRARLFEKINKAALPTGLAALARANDMPWKATPFAGIRQKRLYTNTSDGTTVWLVNMDPGAFYPPHHHTSIEHTFVISGDIIFDGYSLVAGEYQAALPHTDHDKPITTKSGCTVLIINNAKDEIFA